MAIVTAQSKVSAHVAAFSRLKQSQFGDGQYQSVKFVSSDGTVEHWAAFSPEEAKQFTRDQQVNLIPTQRKGKPTYDIEPLTQPAPMGFRTAPAQPVAARAAQPQQLGTNHAEAAVAEQKRAIAEFVQDQSKLYAYCHSQAVAALPDGTDPETLRCAASAVFISANRKFGLER